MSHSCVKTMAKANGMGQGATLHGSIVKMACRFWSTITEIWRSLQIGLTETRASPSIVKKSLSKVTYTQLSSSKAKSQKCWISCRTNCLLIYLTQTMFVTLRKESTKICFQESEVFCHRSQGYQPSTNWNSRNPRNQQPLRLVIHSWCGWVLATKVSLLFVRRL